MSRETICWECKNACGKCSWSSFLEPVDGWDAKATKIVDYTCGKKVVTDSFNVRHCPQFVKDR